MNVRLTDLTAVTIDDGYVVACGVQPVKESLVQRRLHIQSRCLYQ